jgi:ubiquinone/menaquinone biosynthesis C-methylase UbiE
MDASQYNKEIYEKERFNENYTVAFEKRTKKVIGLLQDFEGTLLDVGCGDAEITRQLKDALGCDVKAVELIAKNVAMAKRKGIDARQVDLNKGKLPFNKSSFGAVFAGEVLEHVIDSEGLLLEMKRVLKKDGALVLTVPNIASWYNRILMLFGFLPHYVESGSKKSYGTPFGLINGHVKAFTKKSIVEMLEANGFAIEKIVGSGYSNCGEEKYGKGALKIAKPIFLLLENFLSKKSSLATNIIVKAKKK